MAQLPPDVPVLPPDDPRAALAAADLAYRGVAALDRSAGDDESIDAAVTLLDAAVAAEPDNPEFLHDLGRALFARFETADAIEDLDHAIAVVRRAVAFAPAGHPEVLSSLGINLSARYSRLGRPDDLDEAIAVERAVLDAVGDDVDEQARCLSEIGVRLQFRYERFGRPEDLDEAIAVGRAAAHRVPTQDHLVNLGIAVKMRFVRYGRDADLDEAVQLARAAGSQHPSALAEVLRLRFRRFGELADLDESIAAAYAAAGAASGNRHLHLFNLGLMLQERFAATGATADLDSAITAFQDALDRAPRDHPDRGSLVPGLINALRARNAPADLEKAIRLGRAALGEGGRDNPLLLTNLGGALHARFTLAGSRADLEEATALARAVVAVTPRDDPRWAEAVVNLADTLRDGYDLDGDPAMLREASGLWHAAGSAATAARTDRLNAMRAYATAAAETGRWADALESSAVAVGLLRLGAWQGLGRASREKHLAHGIGVSRDAAASAVAAGHPGRGVELLEQGRGVLWAQFLEARADRTALRRRDPALADRLSAVRAELDAPADPL